ncbi:Inner membrane protein YqjA [Candidatus Ecksteinia adelgidicola]|nr:Inner membrane protein YqjA [Candidatus Ecksteinia adelgidicola]
MEKIKELLHALWQQDFNMLTNSSLVWTLYTLLFVILFLENALLPAAFLPGDSLLILVGVLISKGTMNFLVTIFVLTSASCLGCWLSYVQGKWLGNTKIMKKWLSHLPKYSYQRAHKLFQCYGLSALLIGRFLAFIRTLLPTMAGLSGLSSTRFQFFNWTSGFLWVLVLTSFGFALGKTKIFHKYENKLMLFLIILPIIFLVIGLIGSIFILCRKKYK